MYCTILQTYCGIVMRAVNVQRTMNSVESIKYTVKLNKKIFIDRVNLSSKEHLFSHANEAQMQIARNPLGIMKEFIQKCTVNVKLCY